MKKISILLCVVLIFALLTGCNVVVSEKPIDAQYIAPYDAVETEYNYKYDWWNGEFKYLPETKTVHHAAEYKVQYERVWENGYTETYWAVVSKAEYENILQQIKKGGEKND